VTWTSLLGNILGVIFFQVLFPDGHHELVQLNLLFVTHSVESILVNATISPAISFNFLRKQLPLRQEADNVERIFNVSMSSKFCLDVLIAKDS